MALGGGFPTTHCCCVVGSSKRNKVRNILRVNLDQFIVFGAKKTMELSMKVLFPIDYCSFVCNDFSGTLV